MKRILFILLYITMIPSMAQQSITLEDCYNLVAQNYPLAKQSQLFEAQNVLDTDVITNSKLPQLYLDAKATYQSDVIEVPIPNSSIEPQNKDQYRATFSVNQLIYNGGLTDASLKVKSAQLKTKQKQIETDIYKLKFQVNQLFFSILLVQESYELLEAKKAHLKSKLKEVQSGIKYGTLLPSSDKILEVELLKINQQLIEVENNKIILIETLSRLMSQQLDASTFFQNPIIESPLHSDLNRPELELFQFKKEEIESSKFLLSKQNMPKLHGFATGGYGNPGLNMLDNSFQTFYTVGVNLHWNVFDWNSSKKQQESFSINKDILDTETETFILNTNIELNKQQKEIDKIALIIESDQEIINLRKNVLQISESQLKNGVITSSAYITELTNLYEDENILVRHRIQLQLAKANYNVIKGQ